MLMHDSAVGTCAYMGGVMALPERFAWSWGQMVAYNADALAGPGNYVHYDRATASYHAFARNTLAQRMRGDWLLMLDTDHVFDPDIAARMVHRLEEHRIDVLTGLYQFKTPPHSPVLYVNEGDGPKPLGLWEGPGIFQVHSAGAGCLLVRRHVFQRILDDLGEEPFAIRPPFSEDHSFFERLRQLDIPAYCDPRIESNHLRLTEVTLPDWDRSQMVIGERIAVQGFA